MNRTAAVSCHFQLKKKEKLIKSPHFKTDISKRSRNRSEDADIVLFTVCLINLFLNVCLGGLQWQQSICGLSSHWGISLGWDLSPRYWLRWVAAEEEFGQNRIFNDLC